MIDTSSMDNYAKRSSDELRKFDSLRFNFFYMRGDLSRFPRRDILYRTFKRIKLNNAAIRNYVDSSLPGSSGNVDKVSRASNGTFSITWKIRLSNEEEFLLKLKPHLLDIHNWELLMDIFIGRLLEGRILTSTPTFIDFSHSVYKSTDITFSPFCHGVKLRDLKSVEEYRSGHFFRELGLRVYDINSVRGSGYGLLNLHDLMVDGALRGLHSDWNSYLCQSLELNLRTLKQARVLEDDTVSFIRKSMNVLNRFGPFEHSYIHGDLGDSNVFYISNGMFMITDFEDNLIGDPVFEIASWAKHPFHMAHLNTFLESYFSHGRDYPDHFWRKFYTYLMRLSLSDLSWLYRRNDPEKWRYNIYEENLITSLRRLKEITTSTSE